MIFELVAIPTTRLAYNVLAHHQYVIGLAQAKRQVSASAIFLTTFLELSFELAIDCMGIDVEMREGVSPESYVGKNAHEILLLPATLPYLIIPLHHRYFQSWRLNSVAFFGQHVSYSILSLLLGLWAFNNIPSFLVR